jgi:hypothetical protein
MPLAIVRGWSMAAMDRRDRVRTAGIGAIVAIVAAGGAAQLVNYGLHLHAGVLDSGGDGGAFGVVGDVALALATLAAVGVWGGLRGVSPAAAVLPVLLAFLAVDKILRLHDHVAGWPLYYAPLLLAAFYALVTVARHLTGPHARLIGVGLAMLVVAFVLHVTARAVLDLLQVGENSWAAQTKGAVKHGAEVAGWLLVALGLSLGRPDLSRSLMPAAKAGSATG